MHWLTEYALFLLQTITLLAAILIGFAGLIAISLKNKESNAGKLKLTNLREQYLDYEQTLQTACLDKTALKQFKKQRKQQEKSWQAPPQPIATDPKATPSVETRRKQIFVLRFTGDIKASAADSLREEITAILTSADPSKDEVVVALESPGGLVHGYGFAASQLARIKQKQIKLTVIIDKVAASGGYMMACVADQILAAPFAIVGSIGVLLQLPNFNRLLKKHDIDFEQLSAGEYKRTLSLFGENTEAGRHKLQQELEETHELFKQFIQQYRPQVDLTTVATGEHWYGQQALALQLIDGISTSDDYLQTAAKEANILLICFKKKASFVKKLSEASQSLFRTSTFL